VAQGAGRGLSVVVPYMPTRDLACPRCPNGLPGPLSRAVSVTTGRLSCADSRCRPLGLARQPRSASWPKLRSVNHAARELLRAEIRSDRSVLNHPRRQRVRSMPQGRQITQRIRKDQKRLTRVGALGWWRKNLALVKSFVDTAPRAGKKSVCGAGRGAGLGRQAHESVLAATLGGTAAPFLWRVSYTLDFTPDAPEWESLRVVAGHRLTACPNQLRPAPYSTGDARPLHFPHVTRCEHDGFRVRSGMLPQHRMGTRIYEL